MRESTTPVVAQGMICNICGVSKDEAIAKRLVKDHNHTTGKNRALLCDRCNGRLGSYEHRLVRSRKTKGEYKIWVDTYQDKITEHLKLGL